MPDSLLHRLRVHRSLVVKSVLRIFRLPALTAVIVLAAQGAAPAAPIYVEEHTFTNEFFTFAGMNNAGDLVGSYVTNYLGSVFLIRDGVLHDLYPHGVTPSAVGCWANKVTERRSDGSIQIVGRVEQSDGFYRGIVWTVAADGTYSCRVLSNFVLEPGTAAPGEQATGEAVGVNKSGVVVGNGNSYLASVGLRWDPPYDKPIRYAWGSVCSTVDVDDQGNVLLNGVEYDHNNNNNRWNATILTPGGVLHELPYWAPANEPFHAMARNGSRVIGKAFSAENERYHACVWTNGSASLYKLPYLPEWTVEESVAESVNANGDIVGHASITDDQSHLVWPGYHLILWKNTQAGYKPYVFQNLLPLENNFPMVYNAAINDSGEIACLFSPTTKLQVFRPIAGGIVEYKDTWCGGSESDFFQAKVSFLRADGNNGTVTVHYETSDREAQAGKDYVAQSGTLTWGPGESGDKVIQIPVLKDLLYEPDEYFNLTLSSPIGAQLSYKTNLEVLISGSYERVEFTNLFGDPYWAYAVRGGESNVQLSLVRTYSAEGTMVITNFQTVDITACAGVSYVGVTNNVNLTWKPGETSERTCSVPLLPWEMGDSPVYFSAYVEGYIDDPTNYFSMGTLIYILPPSEKPQPRLDASKPLLEDNKLSLTTSLGQGMTAVLESSTDLSSWQEVSSVKSTNGVVRFAPEIRPQVPGLFYRVRVE